MIPVQRNPIRIHCAAKFPYCATSPGLLGRQLVDFERVGVAPRAALASRNNCAARPAIGTGSMCYGRRRITVSRSLSMVAI